jgi:HlyD family secretion protein
MLTDGQSIQDVPAPNKVWTLEDGVFKAHKVEVGLTNGITTEITSGLKAGQKVVTGFQIGGGDEPADGAKNNNPFMPKMRSNKKNAQGGK